MRSILDDLKPMPPAPPGTPIGEVIGFRLFEVAVHVLGRWAMSQAQPQPPKVAAPPKVRTLMQRSKIPAPVRSLGLTAWPCTRGDVQRAFERLVLTNHPDRAGGKAGGFDGAEARRTRDAALAEVDAFWSVFGKQVRRG